MAETIVVQRGNIGTFNMHVYPGDRPTGLWASIEAQNAGIVAGNWQSHLVCSPDIDMVEIDKYDPSPLPQQLNQWRVRWPRLGSYSRLSFWSLADAKGIGAAPEWDYILRLWDGAYTTNFYSATLVLWHNEITYTERVAIGWDMEESGLSSYIDTDIFVEIIAMPSEDPDQDWTMRANEFSLYTANRPL